MSPTRNSLDNVDVEPVGRRRRPESPSQNLASGEDRQKRRAVVITLHQSADEQSAASRAPFPAFFLLHDVLIRSLPRQVTAIALSAGLEFLAIGLGDGTVILYRHLDQSVLSGSASLTAIPKPRTVHESPTEPVTALGFREPTDETPATYLFIATTNHVLVYQASGRGSGGAANEVHEAGAALGCAVMDWKAHDMVVARDEAIFICGAENRGSSYAYEGTRQVLPFFLSTDQSRRSEDLRAHSLELSCDCLATPRCQCDVRVRDNSEFCRTERGCQRHRGHKGHRF